MIKSKKIRYILFPAVILIWGLIGYNIISAIDEPPINYNVPQNNIKTDLIENKPDSFKVIANYKDPFLGSVVPVRPVKSNPNPDRAKNEPPKDKKPAIDWSFIKYYGTIKNKKSGRLVGLLSISGQRYLVNKGEVFNEVKVMGFTGDSVKVRYRDEVKVVYKVGE